MKIIVNIYVFFYDYTNALLISKHHCPDSVLGYSRDLVVCSAKPIIVGMDNSCLWFISIIHDSKFVYLMLMFIFVLMVNNFSTFKRLIKFYVKFILFYPSLKMFFSHLSSAVNIRRVLTYLNFWYPKIPK